MEKMSIFETFLTAASVAAIICGLGGWFSHLTSKAQAVSTAISLPVISYITSKPVCNFGYPYGYAPHRIPASFDNLGV